MAHITTNIRQHSAPVSLAWLSRHIALALGTARQRRQLAGLTDAQLRDIGLTRADARTEAQRPIWDVPSAWLR